MKTSDSRSIRYRLLLRLAQTAKTWENVWPRLWPAACLLGAFVAMALLDFFPLLPPWLHALTLAMFAVAMIAALIHAIPAFKPVSEDAARRRLERDSGLAHQPLSAMDDSLAAGRGNPVAEALWQRHRTAAARHADAVSLGMPNTDLARHEPWGIRAAVFLAVAAGAFVGGSEAGPRFERALTPGLGLDAAAPATVEIWVTPPEYTRQAPVFLQFPRPDDGAEDQEDATPVVDNEAAAVIPVPAGSHLTARVTGPSVPPMLRVGDRGLPFEIMETGHAVHRVEGTIDAGDRIAVDVSGDTIAAWNIEVVADAAPTVDFSEPLGTQGNGLLRIGFAANDDYGIDRVEAIIESADPMAAPSENTPYRFTLPLSTTSPTTVSGSAVRDLTPHEWAGRPVSIRLEATDVAGQTGVSGVARTILPERHFSHPIARHIVAERKRLFGSVEAVTRREVASILDGIGRQPQFYANNVVVSLAMSVAKSRLLRDESNTALPSVRDLLWDTALRLEEGDVPFAERRLSQARQALVDALRGNADSAEIDRLMDELQRALNDYLAAVAAELARRDQLTTPSESPSEMVGADDLRRLLEMARDLARSGAREGAQQLLSQLNAMLDAIRQGLDAGNTNQQLRQAQQLLQGLNDLAARQQNLLDDTFEQLRNLRGASPGLPGRPQAGSPADQAQAQEALRRALGELMLQFDQVMGGIPGALGEAERAMDGAGQALGEGRLGAAVPQQNAAIDALERARGAASQALAQQLGGLFGMMGGNGEGGDGSEGDIFGRAPADGQRGFGVGQVKIPDAMDIQRAREIIDELRERAADRQRPTDELDYIERLLRLY